MALYAVVQGGVVNAADINQCVTQINYLTAPTELLMNQTTTTTSASTSGSWASIAFSDSAGVILDTAGGHSTTTNPSRWTPNVAGYYTVSGVVNWTTNATGVRGARIAKNGSPVQGSGFLLASQGSVNQTVPTHTMDVFLNGTTDYIELQGYQTSGGALSTVIAADVTSSLWAKFSHS